MSPILVAAVVLGLIITALVALALYKAGFKVEKITAKLLPLEIEASRTKPERTPGADKAETTVHQEASEGGRITNSGISAPAVSGAKIDQGAEGKGSQIDESPIQLT